MNSQINLESAKKTISDLENGELNPTLELINNFNSLQKKESQNLLPSLTKTNDIFADIAALIEKARHEAYKSVNVLLIQRNWMIGKRIHEEELKDTRKENYGLEIIKDLSKKLTKKIRKRVWKNVAL